MSWNPPNPNPYPHPQQSYGQNYSQSYQPPPQQQPPQQQQHQQQYGQVQIQAVAQGQGFSVGPPQGYNAPAQSYPTAPSSGFNTAPERPYAAPAGQAYGGNYGGVSALANQPTVESYQTRDIRPSAPAQGGYAGYVPQTSVPRPAAERRDVPSERSYYNPALDVLGDSRVPIKPAQIKPDPDAKMSGYINLDDDDIEWNQPSQRQKSPDRRLAPPAKPASEGLAKYDYLLSGAAPARKSPERDIPGMSRPGGPPSLGPGSRSASASESRYPVDLPGMGGDPARSQSQGFDFKRTFLDDFSKPGAPVGDDRFRQRAPSPRRRSPSPRSRYPTEYGSSPSQPYGREKPPSPRMSRRDTRSPEFSRTMSERAAPVDPYKQPPRGQDPYRDMRSQAAFPASRAEDQFRDARSRDPYRDAPLQEAHKPPLPHDPYSGARPADDRRKLRPEEEKDPEAIESLLDSKYLERFSKEELAYLLLKTARSKEGEGGPPVLPLRSPAASELSARSHEMGRDTSLEAMKRSYEQPRARSPALSESRYQMHDPMDKYRQQEVPEPRFKPAEARRLPEVADTRFRQPEQQPTIDPMDAKYGGSYDLRRPGPPSEASYRSDRPRSSSARSDDVIVIEEDDAHVGDKRGRDDRRRRSPPPQRRSRSPVPSNRDRRPRRSPSPPRGRRDRRRSRSRSRDRRRSRSRERRRSRSKERRRSRSRERRRSRSRERRRSRTPEKSRPPVRDTRPGAPIGRKDLSGIEITRTITVNQQPHPPKRSLSPLSQIEPPSKRTPMPSSLMADPPRSDFNAFCPICCKELQRVQKLPLVRMTTLRDHVHANHFPWYLCVTNYDTKRDGTDARRTVLADQLHPVLVEAMEGMSKIPLFFAQLWGKMLQGFLLYLTEKLALHSPSHLESSVIIRNLYPSAGIITDANMSITDEEKVMMRAHQVFLNDGMKVLEIAPPNCLSSVLHWITLVNLICQLPEPDRKVSRVSYYNHTNFFAPEVPPVDKSTYSSVVPVLVKFWEYVLKSDIAEMVEILIKYPKVLKERHWSGVSSLQLALSKKCYNAARVMLFYGADVDEQDRNEMTSLSRAAKAGDVRAAQLVLAWGAKAQWKKAMVFAQEEGNNLIFKMIKEAADVELRGARPKISEPPRSRPRESIPAAPHPKDPYVDKVRKLVSHEPSMPEQSRVPRPGKPPPKPIKMTLTGGQGQKLFGKPIKLKPPQMEPEPMELDSGDEQSEPQRSTYAMLCEICMCRLKEGVDMRTHFITEHLPWYLGVDHLRDNTTELGRLMMPCLHAYVLKRQVPFEFFAKCWGKLVESFLLELAKVLSLSEPSDLVWYVTRKKFIPGRRADLSQVEKLMVKCHRMYLGEEGQVVISPPNCSSAVLHWTCLFNIFGKLTWQQRMNLTGFEAYKDIEPLKRDILPRGFSKTLFSGKSELLRRKEFWSTVEKGDMDMLWKILIDNRKFVLLSGSSNDDFSPVQAALSRRHPMVARLLLFYGSPPEMKDSDGFTPLWRAASDGKLDDVVLLLPWASKEQRQGAIGMAKMDRHNVVVEVIENFVGVREKKPDKRASGGTTFERIEGKKPPQPVAPPAVAQPSAPRAPVPAAVPYTPASAWQTQAQLQTSQYSQYPPQQPAYGGTQTYAGAAIHRPPLVRYPTPAMSPASQSYPRQPQSSYSYPARPAMSGYQQYPQPVPRPVSRPMGAPRRLPTTYHPQASIYQQPRAPPPVPGVTNKLAASAARARELREVTLTKQAAVIVNSPALHNIQAVTITPGKIDFSCQSFLITGCPICGAQYKSVMDMKYHVVTEHLPWYFALKFYVPTNTSLSRSTLAKQLLPVLQESFTGPCKVPPFAVFFRLLGKLVHGFLEMIAKLLGLVNVQDLQRYVVMNKFYPNRAVVHTPDEKLLFQAHKSHTKDISSDRNLAVSPPNCLSTVLHWSTIANLISRFPLVTRDMVQTYEGYTGKTLLPRNPPNKSVSAQLILRMQRCISDNNLYSLHDLLEEYPKLANVRIVSLNGISPLEFALGLVSVKTPQATILALFGADTDHQNNIGSTALKNFSRLGNVEAVKFLVNWGASKQSLDSYEAAFESGHEEICTFLLRELPMWLEGKVKPPSQIKRISEMSRQAKAGPSKTGRDAEREHVTGIEACPLCDYGSLSLAHVATVHLPWYASLQFKVPNNTSSLNTTNLSMLITKMVPIHQGKRLPRSMLQIIGKLLYDMFEFIKRCLNLNVQKNLVEFVVQNNLWDESMNVDNKLVLDNTIIPAYQQYAGESVKPQYSPPNCVAVLAHWRTLTKLISKLFKHNRKVLLTYETFSWSKKESALPYMKGPVKQPPIAVDDQTVDVRDTIKQHFMTLITEGFEHINVVYDLLHNHPSLVYCKSTNDKYGVIAHVLFLSKFEPTSSDKALLFKTLVLAGAPIDMAGPRDRSALHIAANKNDLFAACLLLQWGVDLKLKDEEGLTASDIAKKEGHTDIYNIIGMAMNGKVRQYVAYTTYIKMLGKSKDAGWNQPSKKKVLGKSCSKKLPWECPICFEKPFTAEHAIKNHLPWYAGLSVQVPFTECDKRRTVLYMRLCRGLEVGTKKDEWKANVPDVALKVIGKLLHEMLKFMAESLKLSSIDDLLEYVADKGLWTGDIEYEVSVHALVMREITMAAHQAFLGKPDKVTVSPPNCPTGLLHWRTLLNIADRMSSSARDKLVTLELFQWDKHKPALPCPAGLITQPIPPSGYPPNAAMTFMAELKNGRYDVMARHLVKYPHLVLHKIPSSTLLHGLVNGSASQQTLLRRLATALLLQGAPLDAVDDQGYTVLHYAVRENKIQVIITLLLWGADHKIKGKDGWAPYDIAKTANLLDICTILEAVDKGELMRVAAIPVDILQDGTVKRATDETFTLPTLPTAPVQSAKKPTSSKQKEERDRSASKSKSTASASRKTCPVCDRDFSPPHVFRNHLPWYAGISRQFTIHRNDPRATIWSYRLTRALTLRGKSGELSIPYPILVVMGKLLNDLLLFMAESLGMKTIEDLVTHVKAKKLHPKRLENWETVQFEVSVAAYEAYSGTKEVVFVAPPNCIAGLLHWETLWNITLQLPQAAMKKVVTYDDGLQWSPTNPVLPYAKGDVAQPAKSTKHPTPELEQQFLLALGNGIIPKVSSLMNKYPALAICQSGPTVLTQALIFNKNTQLPGKIRLAATLMLQGARLEATDMKGYTVLHHAVKSCQCPLVRILLAWGANMEAQSSTGVTPYDMAVQENFLEIVQLFDNVKKNGVKHAAESIFKADKASGKGSSKDRTAEKCLLCDNKDFVMTHCMRNHLPWYAGLQCNVPPTVYDERRTHLYLMLMRGRTLKNKSSSKQTKLNLPDYYLPIFGRLLYDMLDFMAISLGLSCGEDLLQYVLDNDLYCTTEQDHGDHSSLYFGYLASALQFYTETEEREIIYSPPNCAAALLRWDHLMVIASKMPTVDREALINFEKYKWDPENPTLPTKQGLKPLPLPDREGLPPLSLNQKSDFMTLIKDSTRESQVTGLVVDQPSYVWSIGKKPLAVGVVTQALVFNVEATGANMTRLLLLSGARINRKDLEGYTALHHAVMKNQLQSVILLLLWGANWTIRANDDHTPKSLARKHVRDDMLKMFDMAERADFARIAAIPLLTLEDETTKKPVSVFQRIIMHRKPRDKKSADDDGEDEACYEPCAMCDKPFGVQHVSTTHLPWYAGLHAMIRPDVEDCRRTALSSVMLRGMKTIKGRVHLPDEFLQIIGKLLHGLLEALTKALKLGTRNELLRYVLDNQLWPKNSTKQHDDVLSSVTTNSYQQYTGLKAPVVYSPPNCVAGLLHWETLYNLISKLEKSDQEVTLMYESYSWNARNPALPSPRGSIHQPQTTDKSSANVPKEVINAFVSNLSIGNALGVSDCLEKYPALVFHKVRSKLSCGVVSKALIFNSVSKPSVRFEMAKVLLLRGAPIDDVDIKGNTALHHAILSKKFSFQMVIFLLLWGADTSVKDASGKRPRDLAKKLGYKDICAIFDMHDSGKIAEITRITPDVYEDRTSIGQKTVLGPIAPVKTGWLCPVCHTATDYHRHHALEKHLPWYVSAGFDYLHLVTNKRITRLSDCVLPSLVTVAQCKDLSPVAEKKTDAALVSCFVSLLGQLHQGLLQYIAKELKLNGISDILSYVKVNGLAPKSEEELKPVDKYAIKCYQLFIDDEPSSTTVAPPSHTSALLYWETLLNLIAKLPARCHREVLSYERYEIPRTKCSVRTMLIEGNVRLKMSLPPTTGITEEVQQKFTQAILTSNLVQLSELLDEWPNLVYVPQETSKMSPVALAVSMKKYNVPGVLFLHGASPDQIDVNGQTALHRAVKKCSWKSVEILLTLGAKSDLPNPLGTTALALAQRKNDSQTLLAFARVDQQKERAILCRADVIVEKAREDVIEGLVMEGIDGIIESRRKAIEKAIEIRQWKIGSGTNKPTKKWVCPLCSTETSAARYHAAAHLPWFTCILGGKPQEQHTSVLCKMLLPILAHDVYDNDRLPADVFVMAWGELWGEFFTYMGRLLGIDSIQGLVDYMETMKIWRGPEYASSCTDKFAAMALQRYLNKKGKPLLIKPTTLMDFVHWESVLNLIAEVHESAWESIAQFENFNIKKTECQFAVKQADSKTPGGKRLVEYLASPSLDDISFDTKKELINHVRQGDIKMVCKMLEEEPKLACLPVPHFQDGGLIAWALNNDKRQVAVAARLSGADPDHPNMLGRSSLHTVASRADMDTATFLLDMGASPLTKSFIDDYATPAEVAQKKGDQKMYDFLKKAEIDFTERAKKPVSVVSTDVPKTTRKRRMPRKAAADDTEAVPMHDEEINIIDELIGGGGFMVVDQADETTEVEKGRNPDKTAESNGEAVIVEHVKLSKEAKIKTEPQDPEFDRVEKGKEPAKKAAEAVADTSEKTTEKQIIDIRIKTEPADDVIMAEAAGDNLSEKTPQPTASTSATEAAPNLSIEDEVPADATVFEFAINDTIILDEEEEDTDVEEHSDVEDEQPLDAETWKSYADKAADKTAEEMDMDNFIVLDDLSDQEGTKGEDTAKEAEPMDTKEKSDDDGNKDKQATDAEKMKEKDQIQTKDDETTTKDAQMVDDDAMDLQIIEDDDEDAEKPERNVEESFEDQHDSDEDGVPTMDDMIVLSEEGSDDEDVEHEVQEYDEYHSDDDPGSPLQILDPILLSSDSEPEGDDRETMEWGSPIPRQPDSANNASNESSLLQVQGSAGDHAATADDAQTEMQHDVGAGEGPLITNIKKEKETDDYYFASQSITGSTTGTNADNNGDSQVETRGINAMLNDETNPTGKEDAIGEQGEEQIMETEQSSSEDAGGGEVSSSVVAPETEAQQMHTIEQEKDELNQTETEKAEDSEEQTHMATGNEGQKEVHACSTEDTPAGEPQDSAVAEETGSQEQNDSAPVAEAEPMETGTGESVDQTVNPEATEEACDDLIKEIDNIMDPETKSAEDVVNVAGQTDDRAENEGQAIVVEEDASAELSSKAEEELKTDSLNAETESKDVETAAPEKTSDEVNTDTVNAEGGSGEKPEAGGGESTTDEVKEVVQE